MPFRKSLRYAFNKAKNEIPSCFKSIVIGYFRKEQKRLNLDTNIPPALILTILLYYYDGEYFTQCNDDLLICRDLRTIIKIRNNWWRPWANKAIGNIWISSISNKIAKWTFIINRTTGGLNTIYIGLISMDKHLNEEFFAYPIIDSPIYTIGNGYTVCAYDSGHSNQINKPLFVVGYKFTIILDTKKSTICYQFDDDITTKMCIFEDIVKAQSVKYKIAVCLKSQNASIRLIDFAQFAQT